MPLKVSDGIGSWIKDFKKSDAPQFKGKSEKERRDQAVAAYLSAKRGPQKEDAFTQGAVERGKVKVGASKARIDAIKKDHDAKKKALDNMITKLRATRKEVRSADKKPEKYVDAQGRTKVRMVPTVREGIEKLSNARLKHHATTGMQHGSYTKKEIDAEHKRRKSVVPNYDSVKPSMNENRRDRLRAKLAAVGKDMKKTADDLKKHTDDYNKRFKPKKTNEEFTFKVDLEGFPALFMKGNSPGSVKTHLRKLVKQPSMVKSVDRMTKHDVKKTRRKQARIGEEAKYDYGTDASVKYMKKTTPGQDVDEKITFNKVRSALYKTAKAMGDVQAVRKKKVGKRVARRVTGKAASRILRKLV
tara:strand:- start:1274 stop:2347 length:1074 start_codon:yes stop_codon:yes gene_type:complete